MVTSVTTSRSDRLLVVTIDNPPVNAINGDVRRGLIEAIDAAEADPSIDGVLLQGAGTMFCGGADINEFDGAGTPPLLPAVNDRIESAGKPVAVAIRKAALGGGLELAMSCHLRIAADDARMALPEVKLGLLPGAGGTQKLPRLIGTEAALAAMTSGADIPAREALRLGLIDAVEPASALAERSRSRLRSFVASGKPPRRTLAIAPPRPGEIDTACDRLLTDRRFRGAVAPSRIVETVRDGLKLDPRRGLAIEQAAFEALRSGPQSAALRYSFFSDRAAANVPGLAGVAPRVIAKVGVIGAGTMGAGIALALLASGVPVTMVEPSEGALERGRATIMKTLAGNVETGRITAQDAATALAGFASGKATALLADVDLVIEAAYEDIDVKAGIFSALTALIKPGAILASNTSYLDIDTIAAATDRPQDVVGLHFFSPANIMKLLEIVKGRHTAPDVLATALALAKRIGKTAVVAGNAPGFIGNRMLAVRQDHAQRIILEGVSPYDVDRVVEAFGMPMGPFRMSDLAGLDLGWSREGSHGLTIRDRLCERDRRGQKSGAGYYDYDERRKPTPSDEVQALIAGFAAQHGHARRAVSDDEILDRLLLPMINEGALILAEGKALRGSDIDVVWRSGYGWPGWRGGPLHWAQVNGLSALVARLRRLGIAPAPLLVDIAGRDGDLVGYANPALAD